MLRSLGSLLVTSSSPMKMLPRLPQARRQRAVDLPQPEGPTMTMKEPSGTAVMPSVPYFVESLLRS